MSDLFCPVCRQPFWLTGDTFEQRTAAVTAWRGCCIPNAPAATATNRVGETVAAGVTSARSVGASSRPIWLGWLPYAGCAAFWAVLIAGLVIART